MSLPDNAIAPRGLDRLSCGRRSAGVTLDRGMRWRWRSTLREPAAISLFHERPRRRAIIAPRPQRTTFAGHNWRTLVAVCDWPGPLWLILEGGRRLRRLTTKEMCSDRPRRRIAERTRLDGPRRTRLRAADSQARTARCRQTSGPPAAARRLHPARSLRETTRRGCGGR